MPWLPLPRNAELWRSWGTWAARAIAPAIPAFPGFRFLRLSSLGRALARCKLGRPEAEAAVGFTSPNEKERLPVNGQVE